VDLFAKLLNLIGLRVDRLSRSLRAFVTLGGSKAEERHRRLYCPG
jgi:hypothetical protein